MSTGSSRKHPKVSVVGAGIVGAAIAYSLARDYNDYPFERLDAQLGFRHRLHQTEVEWRFVVQHPLNKEPVVFVENQYQDDQRYWIGATVTF